MSDPLTLKDYLALPYTIEILPDGEGWFARVVEFEGCMVSVDTYEEVIEDIEIAKRLWIESMLEVGETIPLPRASIAGEQNELKGT